MSDLALQGRPGFHTGYAPIVKLQGLYVPRGSQRRCRRSQSERCIGPYLPSLIYPNFHQNLQSADEMEEEERQAQAAKLQELIRRSGPEDLQEANRLMKVMAGYDTKHKTDYRAKAAEEVGKIQRKARLLEERLQNFKPGDSIAEGDVFEVLHLYLRHFKIASGLT